MKILIAHNDYGRFSGEEQSIENLANMLGENGHEVFRLQKSSAPLMEKGIGIKIKAFFSGMHSFSSKREMKEFLKSEIDLVHVQNLYPFLSPSILKPVKQKGIPIVMRCPNYRLFCPNGLHLSHGKVCEKCLGGKEWWCVLKNCEQNIVKSIGYAARNFSARITGSIVKNVDRFIVLSEFQKRRFVKSGLDESKIRVLPNFTLAVDAPRSELGHVVGFVGRPGKEKGIDQFVEAAKQLPQFKFEVAGDRRALESEIPELPNLEFKGFLSGDDLTDFMHSCRVITIPSQCFEAFPNVAIRAMNMAKPIIASAMGGLPEIVDDGTTGFLYEAQETDKFCQLIGRVMTDDQLCLQLGVAAQKKSESRFSKETFYDGIMNVYQEVLKSGTSVTHAE